FEAEFLGRVRLVTSVAALIGVWIYNRFLKTMSLRRILGAAVVLSATLGMTPLILVTHANRAIGISDRWFSLSDSAVLTVLGQVSFMPVLVLAASICPAGVEATLFALLMSVFNAGGIASNALGGWLTGVMGVTETNFENLGLLIVVANLSSLLPLPFLSWLPSGDATDEDAISTTATKLQAEPVPERAVQ
ncbi:MAG: folate/biopterin family MFS transporter, partial [Cyanobacteria bacterium J06641_5]